MTVLNIDSSISRVVVIGGGRWARVVVEVLHRMLPANVSLSVHSKRNVSMLQTSLRALEGASRVEVSAEWPELRKARDSVVIVVNAARDHADAVRRALEAGASVLVEKPVALTAREVEALMRLAQKKGLCLAAAHVFMFARYLEHFVEHVVSGGEVQTIHIRWADPRVESRYGEQKSYDPGVPVYMDWLPHVLSILNRLVPGESPLLENLEFIRGGARLILKVSLGRKTCLIDLERHALRRDRKIEVNVESGRTYQLDFSSEPGRIYDGHHWYSGDPEWDQLPRPLTTMFNAFLLWASGGEKDARLGCEFGLLVSQFIDKVGDMYKRLQSDWLSRQLSSSMLVVQEDIDYALGELVQAHGSLLDSERAWRIQELRGSFMGESRG